MRSQRSQEGVWSLANGAASCQGAFEGWQTALSNRLKSDMHRLSQARTTLSKRLKGDMHRLCQSKAAAKGFAKPKVLLGAWPTALRAAEKRLRAAVVQESAPKGPGKGFGAWPTALPAAEERLRAGKRRFRNA